MHLFVTGGTGFFGKALLRHWSAGGAPELAGARFTLLSRDPARFRSAHGDLLAGLDVRLVAGDIQRPETLPKGDYTHVLHAATDSTTGLSLTPLQRFNQIVDGTRHVLDLALRCGKPRVLLTSSGGVYGSIAQFPEGVPEDHHGMPDPLEPQNAYSVAKRQAEHLCALYHDAHGLETVVARCFAFVGEDLPLDAHFAIGNFIRDALAGRDIVIQGDGTPVRSYLDQRDLARWLSTLLLSGRAQRAYNVGSGEAVSIAELAAKVAALAPGRRPEVRVMKQAEAGQSARRNFYLPDVRRARDELGLRVEVDLAAAIRDVFRAKVDSGLDGRTGENT
ncbi:NAD-dependent epimerase/dehydratase family protein [Roseateles chitosanitabidus]|uniref:NAD-dependent epimerase/dehydratase family protein n=1 Tax=Roseateles chitosanitabidus TaxID=65048 RepID=UPI0008371860|nr:NAD(P)-dependent oxidoreductase [Roseateles chitosanitabidus]